MKLSTVLKRLAPLPLAFCLVCVSPLARAQTPEGKPREAKPPTRLAEEPSAKRPAAPGRPAARPAAAPGRPVAAAPRPSAPRRVAPPARKKKDEKTWKKIERFVSWFHFGALWYLRYRAGATADENDERELYNNFHVGRGYLTVEFKPLKWFEARITTDIHQDDHGDFKVRLKYLYGKFKIPFESRVITEPFAEVGVVHMPWLDYEEHINYYRLQGTMFMERNGLFNSADLGVTVGVLLGRKLPRSYQKKVNKKYPGTWGSLALGVYNGAGYHGLEKNDNKVFEGRFSLRPLGFVFPNLQLSYFLVVGKGNVEIDLPDWQNHTVMASIEHQYFVVVGQYAMGKGHQKGSDSFRNEDGTAKEYRGASGFLEIKLPWIMGSVWGRYDWWDGPNAGGDEPYHRFIAAYAFHFWGRNKNVLCLDFDYERYPSIRDRWAVTLTLQIKL